MTTLKGNAWDDGKISVTNLTSARAQRIDTSIFIELLTLTQGSWCATCRSSRSWRHIAGVFETSSNP